MVRRLFRFASARTVLLVVGIALTIWSVVPSVPASAVAARCDGRPATIVGTGGDDRLVGTNGPDVINGLGGDDEILGRGGDDRLCGSGGSDFLTGGDGDDRLFGGGGNDTVGGDDGEDDIFGFTGDDQLAGQGGVDFIKGGDGNDSISGGSDDDHLSGQEGNDDLNGERGIDECTQGEGTGANLNCEVADLSVDVSSPASAPEGDVIFTVAVTNNGPSTVDYTLALEQTNHDLQCDTGDFDSSGARLAEGGTDTQMVTVTCVIEGPGGEVSVEATVTGPSDLDADNDTDSSTTSVG